VFAGPPEGIVPGDLNQAGEKPVARLARGAGELAQPVLGARARHELAVADGKCAEHQQALVVVGQDAYQVGQELQGMRVLFQATGRDRRGGAPSAEHGGADEEIRTEGFAGGARHGQQSGNLFPTGSGPSRRIPTFAATGSLLSCEQVLSAFLAGREA
jgi:hypothetical protein